MCIPATGPRAQKAIPSPRLPSLHQEQVLSAHLRGLRYCSSVTETEPYTKQANGYP